MRNVSLGRHRGGYRIPSVVLMGLGYLDLPRLDGCPAQRRTSTGRHVGSADRHLRRPGHCECRHWAGRESAQAQRESCGAPLMPRRPLPPNVTPIPHDVDRRAPDRLRLLPCGAHEDPAEKTALRPSGSSSDVRSLEPAEVKPFRKEESS